MKHSNQTLLLLFLSKCRQLLEDKGANINGPQLNQTFPNVTEIPLSNSSSTYNVSTSKSSYDNAYFYIMFVMVFYSVLAMTLIKCIGTDEDTKDPYEEFINIGKQPMKRFITGQMEEKFDFEEESSL